MATYSNTSCFQGETLVINDQIVQADGTPQNITGWTLAFVVDETLIFLTSNGDYVEITDAAAGQLSVTLASDETLNLTPGMYSYSISRIDVGAAATLTTFTPAVNGRARKRTRGSCDSSHSAVAVDGRHRCRA